MISRVHTLATATGHAGDGRSVNEHDVMDPTETETGGSVSAKGVENESVCAGREEKRRKRGWMRLLLRQ